MKRYGSTIRFFTRYAPGWLLTLCASVWLITIGLLLPQITQLIIDRIVNPALGVAASVNPRNIFNFLLDGFAPDDYFGMLGAIGVGLFVLLAVRYLCHYLRWYTAYACGVGAEKNLRRAIFDKMLRQSSTVTERYTDGDLMTIVNGDPTNLRAMFSDYYLIIFEQALTFALAVYLLASIHPVLLIAPLLLAVTAIVNMIFLMRAMRGCYQRIRDCTSELSTCVQENINGVRIVRAYATEEIEKAKFDKRNRAFRDAYVRQAVVASRFSVVFGAIGQIINLVSIAVGIAMCVQGAMSTGIFATFLSYVVAVNQPLVTMTDYLGAVQNSRVSAARVEEFLTRPTEIDDCPGALPITGNPDLAMRHVSVRLDDREEIVDVSLELPYGKKLGIMGRTGAGKSVLMKTLARFYETTLGETTINGRDIRAYRVEDVRRMFSYVMQDVFLFSNTIDANIALYALDAPREEVVRAAERADADGFIRRLPEGYGTVVGERGLGLSGGQKQRLSIARALLKNAPVLMLDDCTSALDRETEQRVFAHIREHYDGRTLVIASHRAASVRDCDEILYLEAGRVVERGTHDELMRLGGRYCETFTRQEDVMEEA